MVCGARGLRDLGGIWDMKEIGGKKGGKVERFVEKNTHTHNTKTFSTLRTIQNWISLRKAT